LSSDKARKSKFLLPVTAPKARSVAVNYTVGIFVWLPKRIAEPPIILLPLTALPLITND
jgi:hypothetical protein